GSETWVYLEPMVPGVHPLESLVLTLAPHLPDRSLKTLREDLEDDSARGLHLLATHLVKEHSKRAVLLLDQFEELFTLTKSEDERQRFIDLLLTAMTEPRGPIVVLLTLRADFYERLMTYPELGRLIQQSQTLVWPMEIDDLRAVIRGPAALPDVQLAFEGNLVGDLLFEVQGQIGALPLLQFTLEQLFERRKEHLLTLQAYRQIGGVKGALAKRAEDTYLALPSEEHRQLARSLFLRLVDPGSTEQDTTRRRAALAEFSLATSRETEVAHQVAAAFLEARLLTTDERAGMPTIEVSHEALIREWTRLSDWLRQSRGDIRLQQTISADAAEWMHHGKPVDRLYRGSQLSEAQAWAERNVPSKDELAFFQAAAAERERQEAVEQSRLARELTLERRVVSRQRLLVAAMSIFSVVVIVLALLAQVGRLQADAQRQQAEMQRQRAELQTEIAGSRALAAQANYALVKNHVDQALLLSLKANQTYNTYDARDSLLTALEYSPRIIRMLHPGLNPPLRGLDSQVQALAFSPDGQTLASFSNFGSNFLWEMKTNEHYSLPSNFNDKVIGNTFIIDKVVVSPNGQSLAALSNPFRPPQLLHSPASEGMWIWDIKTDTQIAQFQAPYAYQAVAFSPDGKTLASSQCTQYTNGSCAQGRILLWEVTSKKPTSQSLITQGSLAVGLVFSPDRKLLVSSNLDGTVQLWNIASKSLAGQLISDAETGNANNRQEEGMAFSPDGKTLALGKSDGTIILWNVASKKPVGSALVGHTQAVQHLAFSPDGKILASGSDDKTLRLWDVATGLPIGQPLRGHTASISSLVFSPDGKMLASGALDGIIILWNLVADSSVNQQLHVNNALGPGLRLLRVLSAISSPDGQVITLGNGDGKILLREGATGKLLGILDATIDPRDISGPNPLSISSLSIVSLAFSSNGRTLAAGRFDGMIFLWDMGTRKLITHFRLETRLTSIVFDPNSRLLASSYESGTILLWDRATEKVLHHLTHHTYSSNPNDPNVPVLVSTVAFSRDGKRLASGDNDTVIFWDVTTGKQIGQPLVGHRVTVGSVAFSPDGHTLASIDKSGTIILWDIETGKAIGQPLFGLNSSENGEATSIFTFSQTGGVNSGFSFSPNGALLVVGSNLGSVSLWDVARHEPFAHAFQGSTTDFVIGAMFSPNGQRLLVISPSSMTSWDINEGSWQTLACRIVNRNFTADEWKQFAKGERYQKVCPSLPVDNSIVSETQLQAHAASQAGHKQEAVLDYTQATQEAMESADASLNNYVCQQGGLDQFAKVVLPACEYAVKFDPNNVDYRDSRGLGRALAGDIQGAIADFQFVVEPSHGYGSLSADQVKERQLWVQELKSGRNPFDAKTLNALRNE
ncbi:MAG TPA: hypothetical protein VFA10_29355, partial [Ktedonobacteraceae bacterium]|nr:hypothetical protein [Ktedonobacteraceae bacterium]